MPQRQKKYDELQGNRDRAWLEKELAKRVGKSEWIRLKEADLAELLKSQAYRRLRKGSSPLELLEPLLSIEPRHFDESALERPARPAGPSDPGL